MFQAHVFHSTTRISQSSKQTYLLVQALTSKVHSFFVLLSDPLSTNSHRYPQNQTTNLSHLLQMCWSQNMNLAFENSVTSKLNSHYCCLASAKYNCFFCKITKSPMGLRLSSKNGHSIFLTL